MNLLLAWDRDVQRAARGMQLQNLEYRMDVEIGHEKMEQEVAEDDEMNRPLIEYVREMRKALAAAAATGAAAQQPVVVLDRNVDEIAQEELAKVYDKLSTFRVMCLLHLMSCPI